MKVDVVFVYDRSPTYTSGEVVTGQVMVRLHEQVLFNSILLRFLGETSVRWTETETTRILCITYTEKKCFINKELYIDNKVILLGSANGEFVFGPGEQTFPFTLVLPPNTPSSFTGRHGQTRYSAEIIFIRPKKKDTVYESSFDVINNTNLNTAAADLMKGVQRTEEKYLGCCCCRSGPINMVATLPFQGFAIGQICEAVVEIDNPTKNVVTGKVGLYQVIVYKGIYGSHVKERKEKKLIVEETLGEVGKGDSKTFTTSLCIPELPVSHQQITTAITISYYLQFKGVPSGMHLDASIKIPVQIGNIPLENTMPSFTQNMSNIPCS